MLLSLFADSPFHLQFLAAVVIGSGLLCLAVVLGGMLHAWLHPRPALPAGLPPPPGHFPFRLDQIYTALFIAFLLISALFNLTLEGEEMVSSELTWEGLVQGIALQVGLYLPMLVRYALLHPWRRPSQPWWYYITAPLLFLAIIYMAVGLLEHSGFTRWLVRIAECPEHQELVLIFSRGEELQRLYIAICAVMVAPLVEECCFRGFLYTTLRHWGGRLAATFASACLFAAIHGSLAQLLPLTLFGIVQCVAYERARSLWLPIIIHALFNTTSLIATALMQP